MQRNVWEWCEDLYQTYPGGSLKGPDRAGIGALTTMLWLLIKGIDEQPSVSEEMKRHALGGG